MLIFQVPVTQIRAECHMFRSARARRKLEGAFWFYYAHLKWGLNHIYLMAFINAWLTHQITDLTYFPVHLVLKERFHIALN